MKVSYLVVMASMVMSTGVIGKAFGEAGAERVKLSAVPIQSVQIDDPFWAPKYDVWRNVTIKDCLDKFERDGTLTNFDHVAKGDGLLYEMIRGCADFMAEKPDAALKARLDGYIDRIAAAAAKDPDGYVNTYTQLKEPTHRWGQNGGNDRWQHDLYNLGALVDAGVHYYRATGESKLLATAVRAANGMCKVMGPPPKQNIIPGHAIGEESLTRLYELIKAEPDLKQKLGVPVKEEDYLALAKFWIDARGNHAGRPDFGAYDQDAVPALKQQTIEGHAVRAALFSSGMVAVGEAASAPQYVDVASRLWQNMVGRRMYVTGGIGSFANDEKFGPDFMLPNNGYLETCAAVASCFFSENLSLVQGQSDTVDELERSLYNNALAGVALAGNGYFYENPLESGPKRQRWAWHACPCCPPMFLKLMGAMPGYIYSTDTNGGLYVNLFIGSTAKVKAGGADVSLTQTTRYPWNGDVKLAVTAQRPAAFDVYVRVPGWSRGGPSFGGLYATKPAGPEAFSISVNGAAIASPEVTRGYVKLHREWRSGDTVQIHMEMPVQRVTADDRVQADRGRVALMRGPIVYCVESIDNGGHLGDLILPDDASVKTEERPDLLGGVIVLKAQGERVQPDQAPRSAELLAIPYYTNANRGPVEMKTWIPRTAEGAAKKK